MLLCSLLLSGGTAYATCAATDTAVTAASPTNAVTLAADCAALLAVKDTLRGTASLNWANTVSMTTWDGVSLGGFRNNVLAIVLSNRGLDGSIPNFSALTSLRTLVLNQNALSGAIVAANFPASLTSLTLHDNELSGSVPDLSALTSLAGLDLYNNELSGAIVAANFPASLTSLRLHDNELSGSIPDLSALTSLAGLDLHNNKLSGSIPDLSALTSLGTIRLQRNSLSGSIVAANFPASLRTLDLSGNGLSGSVPDFSSLTNLVEIDLHRNELSGSIVAANFPTSLVNLYLDRNGLSGSIPDLSALTSLRSLYLYNNELSGSIPDLRALTSLTQLILINNELSGSLVAANFPTSLQYLYLDRNGLSGSIPDLSALTSLLVLRLHRNELSGSVPATLGNLSNLRTLHLASNGFTGAIPGGLANLTGLADLSLCETDLDSAATLPAALETRRTAGTLSVWSCLVVEDAEAAEGESLEFPVRHSTFPVRGAAGATDLVVGYTTEDGTATSLDYASRPPNNPGFVTIPANADAATWSSTATIRVPTFVDRLGLEEGEETLTLWLSAAGLAEAKVLHSRSSATGTITPVPAVEPPPDDEPEPPASCTLTAPYWSGPTGGFTVRPEPGRTSVGVVCGGRTREYMAEDGLVTRLLNGSCRPTGLQVTGASRGGWYWQHGDRNAAAAPLVCSDALEGPPAVIPGGVTTEATDNGTLFKHDTQKLIGIVPHFAGNECSEYVTPYWQGDGGVVVRPGEGSTSVRVRVQCGRTWSTTTWSPGTDGVIAELVRRSYCTDGEGNPRQGRLTVAGAAPGGWYWIRGERNAAVAPLMCADLLGGPAAVDPGGVSTRSTDDGSYFEHDTQELIGVVPHLAVGRR